MSVPASPSSEVARLASRKGFGRLEHTFLPRKELNVQEKYRGLFIAASVTGIACLATGGVLLWVFVTWALGTYPLLFSALAIGALLNSPNFRKRLGDRRLHLFEEGLLVERGGGRLFAVRWVQAIHYQVNRAGSDQLQRDEDPFQHRAQLHPGGARRHQGGDHELVRRLRDLAAPDLRGLSPAPKPRRRGTRFGRGRVDYGPFGLGATGISTERQGTLPWSAVESIDVREGFVVVRRHGQPKAWGGCRGQEGAESPPPLPDHRLEPLRVTRVHVAAGACTAACAPHAAGTACGAPGQLNGSSVM